MNTKVVHIDLEQERAALSEIIALYDEDKDITKHPDHERLLRFWDAEDAAKKHEVVRKDLYHNANREAPYETAKQFPGRLAGSVQVVLHTKQAYRLLLGRDATETQKSATGLYRFAACCSVLFGWARNDNPYAEMILLDVEERLQVITRDLRDANERFKTLLEEFEARGFAVELHQSDAPVKSQPLQFASPYANNAALLILEFDWYVRYLVTMENTNQMTHSMVRTMAHGMAHKMRGLFERVSTARAVMDKTGLNAITRGDCAKKRPAKDLAELLSAAERSLGELPEEVLSGDRRPAHVYSVAATGGR